MPDFKADIDTLAELQQRRKDFIQTINANTNRARSLVLRAMNWNPNDEEAAREKANGRAAAVVKNAFAGKGYDVLGVEADLEVFAQSIEPLQRMRTGIEKEMRKIAKRLPVWTQWAQGVRGLGDLGLAVIAAECGDLANYSNPAKVWKRLGLAPVEKNGLSMAASNWRKKGGLTADEWTAAGYSPRRRAEIFACVGDPLFRAQSVVVGPYRQVYDRRRQRTAESHPDWTAGHSHGDAIRIMTKELLRDLWVAWNGERASVDLEPKTSLPSSDLSTAASSRFATTRDSSPRNATPAI